MPRKVPLFLLATALAASWPSAQTSAARPNILLVTIDTLRADRLGAYGYPAGRTPVLDRLAAQGVRFADATAHAPLTYPAHVAILTGRYPAAFGARLNGMDPLPPAASTVAETLKAAGYATGAIVASAIVDRASGLSQGFDAYDDAIPVRTGETVAIADVQRRADVVTAAARTWIAGQRGPWFLWVHYYDPHLPYNAPAAYASAAKGRPYDAEVAYVDAQLGVLLNDVDRTRTVVAVTSDHGEALGDHGEEDHGFFLYDATLHVPLIVAAPGHAPRVVHEQVRSIDIAPTLAQLAGLSALQGIDGESLVPLMRGQTRRDVPVSLAESWYPRLHFGWSELKSVRVGEWKYVAAPKPELYDLRTDRGEQRNVISDRAGVAGRLAADLSRITAQFSREERPAAQPDAATVERLQALGYVGSFAPVTSGSATENPKDRIRDYQTYRELFNRALTLLGRGRAAEAATVLQKLLKTNVRAFEAHLYLGNAYTALGKHDAALGEYEAAALLNPSLATPHFEAAKTLSLKGDHDAAAARGRKGLDIDPQSAYGHYTLGVILQKAARWRDAADAFGRAVQLNPNEPRAHANLAAVSIRLGDVDRARVHFGRMIALNHQVAPAQFNLGLIAQRRGDRAEAERRFKLALAADPKFAPAREALAKLR